MTTTLDYISKSDLAKSLGISLATINRKLNEIPHVKMWDSRQSRVLFSVAKIKDYLENHSYQPRGANE